MRHTILAAASVLALGMIGGQAAQAQTGQGQGGQTTPGQTMAPPAAMTPAPTQGSANRPSGGTLGSVGSGASGALGSVSNGASMGSGNPNDHNPAVATSNTASNTPAHGANSFSAGEARRRIEARGFSQVADLKKDQDGVWRGQAKKDGNSTSVWLDYKGNVGQQ